MLVSGGAGTGKTSIAASLADAACARGERALFVSYEESPAQLLRNMRSIGLEEHLVALHRLLDEAAPSLVVLDAMADSGTSAHRAR